MCAAVLMGLAPVGALRFASFAAAVCLTEGESASAQVAPRGDLTARAPLALRAAVDPRPLLPVASVTIWRAPAGPAPSQAPPRGA